VLAGSATIWLGIGLRVWAIAELGRFFRRDVLIQEGHEVVAAGPYRVVRHPAYAGNLVAAVGLGLALGNSLALVILVVVPVLGHIPRIRVEEAELERFLGEPYRRYAESTARLVPGLW
jgi:protein-S-isoprenylcysteine O-methyltransferase Ste14